MTKLVFNVEVRKTVKHQWRHQGTTLRAKIKTRAPEASMNNTRGAIAGVQPNIAKLTYSHAEAALSSRGNIRICNHIRVVKFIEHITSEGDDVGGLGHLLMRHSLFDEGSGEA